MKTVFNVKTRFCSLQLGPSRSKQRNVTPYRFSGRAKREGVMFRVAPAEAKALLCSLLYQDAAPPDWRRGPALAAGWTLKPLRCLSWRIWSGPGTGLTSTTRRPRTPTVRSGFRPTSSCAFASCVSSRLRTACGAASVRGAGTVRCNTVGNGIDWGLVFCQPNGKPLHGREKR